jgi:lipoprotein-releasing system permease protein
MSEYAGLEQKILANPRVKGLSPFAQGQVLLKEANRYFAVGLKAIDPEKETRVTSLKKYMMLGDLNSLGDDGIIIGKELAYYLGLSLNSNLTLYSPLGKQYNLRVAGIFSSGMYDYDMNLTFVRLKTGQEILGLKDMVSSIAVKLDDLYSADKVSSELARSLGHEYMIKTWMEANQSFFAALKLEKITMFVILTLIIFVACFNIVSTLIVMAVEKTKDIGILKALGMTQGGIRRIFTFQGLIIGSLGIFLGGIGGIGLCGLLKKYQFVKLPQDIYYIDRLPVSIELWPDIGLILLSAMAIVLISTVYPAAKAAELKPVEALRYE